MSSGRFRGILLVSDFRLRTKEKENCIALLTGPYGITHTDKLVRHGGPESWPEVFFLDVTVCSFLKGLIAYRPNIHGVSKSRGVVTADHV